MNPGLPKPAISNSEFLLSENVLKVNMNSGMIVTLITLGSSMATSEKEKNLNVTLLPIGDGRFHDHIPEYAHIFKGKKVNWSSGKRVICG